METKVDDRSKSRLYILTMIIELVCGLGRTVFITFFLVVLAYFLFTTYVLLEYGGRGLLFVDWSPGIETQLAVVVGIGLGYGNVITSGMAYMGFGGGSLLTRFVLGAREPSTREKETLHQLFAEMVENADFKIGSFSMLYILDSPMPYANVVGTSLYISSGALRGQHLSALIAHEFGHLNNGDGRVVLALRRLVFPVFALFISSVRDFSTGRPGYRPDVKEFDAMQIYFAVVNKILFFLLAFLGGGIGVWLLSWGWASYFRKVDYKADAFAVRLGYKDELLEYLEQNLFFDTAVPYMLGWQPANELRIDAIHHPELYGLEKSEPGESRETAQPAKTEA